MAASQPRRRRSDRSHLPEWLPERWYRDVWLFLITVVVLLTVFRIGGDEHRTCTIQARGLPAGHELAASMADIHALLIEPRRQGEPAPPPAIATIVADLNLHLGKYAGLEAGQPRTRSC